MLSIIIKFKFLNNLKISSNKLILKKFIGKKNIITKKYKNINLNIKFLKKNHIKEIFKFIINLTKYKNKIINPPTIIKNNKYLNQLM